MLKRRTKRVNHQSKIFVFKLNNGEEVIGELFTSPLSSGGIFKRNRIRGYYTDRQAYIIINPLRIMSSVDSDTRQINSVLAPWDYYSTGPIVELPKDQTINMTEPNIGILSMYAEYVRKNYVKTETDADDQILVTVNKKGHVVNEGSIYEDPVDEDPMLSSDEERLNLLRSLEEHYDTDSVDDVEAEEKEILSKTSFSKKLVH